MSDKGVTIKVRPVPEFNLNTDHIDNLAKDSNEYLRVSMEYGIKRLIPEAPSIVYTPTGPLDDLADAINYAFTTIKQKAEEGQYRTVKAEVVPEPEDMLSYLFRRKGRLVGKLPPGYFENILGEVYGRMGPKTVRRAAKAK